MKLRNGFVSNSSSSSFIVDISDPKTKEIVDMLTMLFPPWDGSAVKITSPVKEDLEFMNFDENKVSHVENLKIENLREIEIDDHIGLYLPHEIKLGGCY